MSSRQETIRSIYDDLLLKTGDPGQRVRIRIDESAPIKLQAACVFPDKKLILEIGPIKNVWLPQGFKKPRIKGLSISLSSEDKIPGSDITLLLELQKNEALDVFTVFVARVCDELDKLVRPHSAVKTVVALIEKWKEFFSGGSDILSEERQTGLYGELYLLQFFALDDIDIGIIVKAWTGSKKTSQDYEFGPVAVEVKSSGAVDASRIKITNSRQLDDTGLETLYLARALFDIRQGEDQTLPKLIEKIRQNIQTNSPEASLDFEEKLLGAGYQDIHVEQYNYRTYTERDLCFYKITGGFPRLIEKNFPEGITKVSYEVDLNMCIDFIIDNEEVIKVLRTSCD